MQQDDVIIKHPLKSIKWKRCRNHGCICFISCVHSRLQSLMFLLVTIFQHFLHLVTFVLYWHTNFSTSASASLFGNMFKLSNCNKPWQLCQPLASLCCFYFYIEIYFSNKVAVCFIYLFFLQDILQLKIVCSLMNKLCTVLFQTQANIHTCLNTVADKGECAAA